MSVEVDMSCRPSENSDSVRVAWAGPAVFVSLSIGIRTTDYRRQISVFWLPSSVLRHVGIRTTDYGRQISVFWLPSSVLRHVGIRTTDYGRQISVFWLPSSVLRQGLVAQLVRARA